MNRENEYPEQTAGDIAHTTVRAGLSVIPVLGGPIAEFFNLVVAPPLEKRREEWLKSVAEDVEALKDKMESIDTEELSRNEQFITTVITATQTAMRTHQTEKLDALRSAVLNSALPSAPEEDLQLMFLAWVDNLTAWHLRILKLLHDPIAWEDENNVRLHRGSLGSSITGLIHSAYPELVGRDEFTKQLVKDLYSRGLTTIEQIGGMLSAGGAFQSKSTDIGKQFLGFITCPLE